MEWKKKDKYPAPESAINLIIKAGNIVTSCLVARVGKLSVNTFVPVPMEWKKKDEFLAPDLAMKTGKEGDKLLAG